MSVALGVAAPNDNRQTCSHYVEHACASGCADAALAWHKFGLSVMPIQAKTKIPATPWDAWVSHLSEQSITAHWQKHPDHQLGFIVGDDIVVFDADSAESIEALTELEQTHGLTPNLVVMTRRGEHHFYRRDKGTRARTDSHSTEAHPERIDVKTGRSIVVLPPSKDKAILRITADSASDLVPVTQAFVDAVFVHNGREAPSATALPMPEPITQTPSFNQLSLAELSAMVSVLDPDMGYEDWLHVLLGIYHETQGSPDGFNLAVTWSKRGKKYRGESDLRTKWNSFKGNRSNPVTIGTIRKLVTDAGHDWMAVCSEACDPFTADVDDQLTVDTSAIVAVSETQKQSTSNALSRFSLRGRSDQIEALAMKQEPLLDEIALLGQLTAFYAAPNTGKTLLVLRLLIDAIKAGTVNADKVYYVNVDDTSSGLLQKVRLAEDYGFHMLSEGYRDFTVSQFTKLIVEITANQQSNGVVIILDTLKKFTDLMDKTRSSSFSKVMRRFALQGGTVIALAHTNKNPGRDGKPVYSGTTDIVDDWDCAYTLTPIPGEPESNEKIVEFENIKRRGDVASTAAFAYTTEKGSSYYNTLLSVRKVKPDELMPIKEAESVRSDADLIAAASQAIREGIVTKMRLVDAVSERCTVSQRTALRIIEKYTGTNPSTHQWHFSVKARGAKVFQLLPPSNASAPETI